MDSEHSTTQNNQLELPSTVGNVIETPVVSVVDTNTETKPQQTYQLHIKFNTNISFEPTITNQTTINDLSKMCVLQCSKLYNAPLSAVPDALVSRCKLVFKGKIISNPLTCVTSVEGITDPTKQVFCIMAPITKADIESIQNNMGPSDEDVIMLLASDNLRSCLAKPANYAHLANLLGVEYVVPQTQIDNLLASEAILAYVKKTNNYLQVTDWANMGGQVEPTFTASTTVTSSVDGKFNYQQTLTEVLSMGFPDNEATRNVITMFKGNVTDAVNHLISM